MKGCGPKFTPRFIQRGVFRAACTIHDWQYEIGGVPRITADKLFLINMVKQSDKFWHIPLAIVYYYLVRLFGWIFYKEVKNVKGL